MQGRGSAGFDDLPPHLAAAVVHLAFDAEGRRLLSWLHLSLVSRTWRSIMVDETVVLELPMALTETQWRWLASSRIPIRSLRFLGEDVLTDGAYWGPAAIARLLRPLPGSDGKLLDLHNVVVHPDEGHKWLRQLERLGVLSMTVSSWFLMVASTLPEGLTSLTMHNCHRFEDTQLSHLTALRDLSLSHEASSVQFAARPFSLAELPPSLERLRLRLPSDSVRLLPFGNPRSDYYRPGRPSAPTKLLQVECQRLVFGDVRSVTRFHPNCAVFIRARTLHFKADAYGDDNRLLGGPGGSRACVSAWLAAWVARSEAASMRLASWEARTDQGTREIEVLVGGRPGRSLAATFDGPRELAALMAPYCEPRGKACRLVADTVSTNLVEVVMK